ncbi:MAG: type II toxin-antitoxin system death-on-curing family toxin [Acidobacteriota bacterium]|nr:type II toxin-antitoxin system death-on-curing family toxin [Acidobacteriota bacterium]
MPEPIWVTWHTVLAIHQQQLKEHGGSSGIRDRNLLESALARPQQIFHYSDDPSLPQLAAAYAGGITNNHPFLDGNKRTGFVVMAVFLARNGHRFQAPQVEVVTMMLALAAGSLPEDRLAEWIGQNLQSR